MLLISGPPCSGKTSRILERIRDHLRARHSGVRLLVPTATCAEHIRNALAREGYVFHPDVVQTFSKFVSGLVNDLPQASRAAVELLAGRALSTNQAEAFAASAKWPGLAASIAELIDELSLAGCDAAALSRLLQDPYVGEPYGMALAAVYGHVTREMETRGWRFRSERLQAAADRIAASGLDHITDLYIDGFAQFTRNEIEVLTAIGRKARLTVTLPGWPGAEHSRNALQTAGFRIEQLNTVCPKPAYEVVAAYSIEAEAREIGRRILQRNGEGVPFSSIGIVVRSEAPAVPVLRQVLEGFGIPARYHFAPRLETHPAARVFRLSVEAVRKGCPYQELLDLFGSTAAGLRASRRGFQFSYLLRELLPAAGDLPGLREQTESARIRQALLAIDNAAAVWTPATAETWRSRLTGLLRAIKPAMPFEPLDAGLADTLRSHAGALQALEEAIEQSTSLLPPKEAAPLKDVCQALDRVIRHAEIRVQDRRANVVSVMDVYEARQWRLPVVFVCGLLEKQFPRYHEPTPILSDATRRHWKLRNINLRTASDWQDEEEFLFKVAITRATESLTLSYAVQNSKGEENLRSFFLARFLKQRQLTEARSRPARLRPSRQPAAPRHAKIVDPALRAELHKMHSRLSPSSLEGFLQCPYKFFAQKTLRLTAPPPRPEERLDALVQGNIVHSVMREWQETGAPIVEIFEKHFEEACTQNRVVRGYRSEYVRLEILRSLQSIVRESVFPPAARYFCEETFEFDISPDLRIRGRIDCLAEYADGTAVVTDFKYSAPQRIKSIIKDHEEGLAVQGGIYMLAAQRAFGLRPAGMNFAGLRKQFGTEGWQGEEAQEIIGRALQAASQAHASIIYGQIEPRPARRNKCDWCDFTDICRVESEALIEITAEGA